MFVYIYILISVCFCVFESFVDFKCHEKQKHSQRQKVKCLPLTCLTASPAESETSVEGRHAGESHLSQKSAARRENGADRCVRLKHISHAS